LTPLADYANFRAAFLLIFARGRGYAQLISRAANGNIRARQRTLHASNFASILPALLPFIPACSRCNLRFLWQLCFGAAASQLDGHTPVGATIPRDLGSIRRHGAKFRGRGRQLAGK
jgi:hypothetical protein